jgi:hypothetical protein
MDGNVEGPFTNETNYMTNIPESSVPAKTGLPVLLLPALLLLLWVRMLWPYCQFYIDPDAVCYLSIVERYIAGDYTHAVNAYWSPMGCWLTVLMVKLTQWPLFQAAIAVNALGAAGMTFMGQVLFARFQESKWERWVFGLISSVFWAYTVYFQSFTDIWQLFLLTLALHLLCFHGFVQRPLLWVVTGMSGALAYFGKAYAFVFFPLMVIVAIVMWYRSGPRLALSRYILAAIATVLLMLLFSFPWLYLLHEKYGIWTTSTAGALNRTWFLVGTQEFKPGIQALVPPVYTGSLFYFEDPYWVQGALAGWFDSMGNFIKLLMRVGFNGLNWFVSANRVSAFYIPVWLSVMIYLFRTWKRTSGYSARRIAGLIFLLYPLPFWTLTFDNGRHLWYTMLLCCIAGSVCMRQLLLPLAGTRGHRFFALIFYVSFLITPLLDTKEMWRTGVEEYNIGRQLKAQGISGPFVANKSYEEAAAYVLRVTWFSGNPWYCHTQQVPAAELLREAKAKGLKYYYYFGNDIGQDAMPSHPEGGALRELTGGCIPGLRVYEL